jgi:hypothetical protein
LKLKAAYLADNGAVGRPTQTFDQQIPATRPEADSSRPVPSRPVSGVAANGATVAQRRAAMHVIRGLLDVGLKLYFPRLHGCYAARLSSLSAVA